MSTRLRTLIAATALVAALPAAVAVAGPASASGGGGGGAGGGGGGGKSICTLVSTQTLPGITTKQTFPVLDVGTVTIKRDAVNDGLVVGALTAAPGWSASKGIKAGPKVSAQWQQDRHHKVELEAAQSTAYYGPDILVIEIKSCTR